MKQRIRLTESDLHRMIKESVRQVLREGNSFSNMGIEDNELVKIASQGDYMTAYIDYLKEGWDNPSSAPNLEEFIQMVKNQTIRYVEDENGIYYVNDWNG